MNPILGLFLNLLVPWDFTLAYLVDRFRRKMAALFKQWTRAWYQLESLISLANYSDLNPETSFPEITMGGKCIFKADNLGHPLIPFQTQVRNDFFISNLGELVIITGSNMAGKSTFIKTIGINLCLAYAGGAVDASNFHSTIFRLHTCIRVSDSIPDGFSYFYAEVRCLRKLMESLNLEGERPLIFLIDEIFRGTNNRERLIGSQAYIQSIIGHNGIGFVATHDLELANLAQKSPLISNFHFRDSVKDGKLVFDYKIRPGQSPTTNALKIMQMEGLPIDTNELHG